MAKLWVQRSGSNAWMRISLDSQADVLFLTTDDGRPVSDSLPSCACSVPGYVLRHPEADGVSWILYCCGESGLALNGARLSMERRTLRENDEIQVGAYRIFFAAECPQPSIPAVDYPVAVQA